MTHQEFNAVILSGEGYKVEFKQSLNSDLAKEMVAFANASGGRIFIGVADDGALPGVTITNKLRSEIQNIAQACDPPVKINLSELDNRIVIIEIPEGSNKPYRSTAGFYLRTGANSIKLGTNQIIEFIKTEGKVRFDELRNPAINYPAERNDGNIQRYMKLAGINTTLTPDDLLSNLGVLYEEDNKVINNAGVLFFISNPSKYIPQNVITCVAYKGNEKVHILDKKSFDLDVITNIDETITFLKKHLNLSYVITEKRRKEVLEIPEVVLREVIVNAAAHRDYFEKGAVIMVEVFTNRIEVSNPGGLPKGLSEQDFGTKTLARNPVISSLLNRAEYIEKLGTGIPRIRESMAEAGLPEPEFAFGNFFTVVLRRHSLMIELKKELKIPESKAKRIVVILKKLYHGKKLETEKIAGEIGTSARTIRNDINTLEAANWVIAKGATVSKVYEFTPLGKEKVEKFL